ncbi:MAG: hypothetical protein JW889_00270 [Verrucomicrobia bacterium]|nr:hypothetical protein [Verrucomicrobiota bacterium]
MVTRRDYNREAVEAARSVLAEVLHLLGRYREGIVLVGGWVPEFLCPSAETAHVGSLDIDLAVDHRTVTGAAYRTIRQLLLERGYEPGPQPFIFYRAIQVAGRVLRVQLDLLGGEYGGTAAGHRTQTVQDVRVRKARGADLAFESPLETTVEATLPGGGTDAVRVRVASLVPFVVMKSMALDERLKEKDAWDIYYCIKHYLGGADAVVEAFTPRLGHGLVRDGLARLAKHFGSVDAIGPAHVANFEEINDPEERARVIRDAFERVHDVLERLGVA